MFEVGKCGVRPREGYPDCRRYENMMLWSYFSAKRKVQLQYNKGSMDRIKNHNILENNFLTSNKR